MLSSLLDYNYKRIYKRHLMEFGLIYIELMNIRFKKLDTNDRLIKDKLSGYFRDITDRLHDEFEISDSNYKLSKEKSVFKSNFYLLGIELKSYKCCIEETYNNLNYKNEFSRFLNYLITRLTILISNIEREVIKWKSREMKRN